MRGCSDTSLTGIPKASKPLRNMTWLDLSGCNLATNPSFLPGVTPEDPISSIAQMPELKVGDFCRSQGSRGGDYSP